MQNWRRLLAGITVLAMPMLGAPAHAQVLWDDYQGVRGMLGSSNQDKPGPAYDNGSGGVTERLAALRAIAADSANATRSGSSTTIDYIGDLCNTDTDTAGTGAACQADAMGRVAYALVKFPAAGTYRFEAAHDDEIDLALSSSYTSTAYRTATYDLPVGVVSWFTGTTNFDYVGRVFAPSANSCALLRIYWNNFGGANTLRLRWDRPGANDELIPSTQLFDPSQASSSTGCTGAVVAVGEITLNKVVAGSGRVAAADQFSVAIVDNGTGTTQAVATTTGAGTGQQASTGVTPVGAGILYRLTDAMAAGSANTIAAYVPTISCTRNGTGFVPGGAAPNWTASVATGDQIVCAITNTRAPPPTVAKSSFPIYDPVNSTNNPKFIPGGAMKYVLTVSNPGNALTSDSIVISDPVPANLRLFVGNISGSGPVLFIDGSTSSTLTCTYSGLSSTADDIEFSNDGGATWTYVPVPDAQNYDPAVTNIRIRPKGSMAPGSSAQFVFQAAIN